MSAFWPAFTTAFGWVAGIGLAMALVVVVLLFIGRAFNVDPRTTAPGRKQPRPTERDEAAGSGRWKH